MVYDNYRWQGNIVNNVQDEPYYSIVAADGMTYADWYNQIIASEVRNPYTDIQRRLHSKILSTAPYPWVSEEMGITLRELTDTSIPAALMYNKNAEGSKLLGKAITDITQHEDGTVSFMFRANGHVDRLEPIVTLADPKDATVYTLQGIRVVAPHHSGIYIRNGKKFKQK